MHSSTPKGSAHLISTSFPFSLHLPLRELGSTESSFGMSSRVWTPWARKMGRATIVLTFVPEKLSRPLAMFGSSMFRKAILTGPSWFLPISSAHFSTISLLYGLVLPCPRTRIPRSSAIILTDITFFHICINQMGLITNKSFPDVNGLAVGRRIFVELAPKRVQNNWDKSI
jgi:hypothetical protein